MHRKSIHCRVNSSRVDSSQGRLIAELCQLNDWNVKLFVWTLMEWNIDGHRGLLIPVCPDLYVLANISRFNKIFSWHNPTMNWPTMDWPAINRLSINRPLDKSAHNELTHRWIDLAMNRPYDESTYNESTHDGSTQQWLDLPINWPGNASTLRWVDAVMNQPAMNWPFNESIHDGSTLNRWIDPAMNQPGLIRPCNEST
jgi:hypothetical protein